MPDYNDFEWEGLKIRPRPTGWRNTPVLGKVLRKWPYFTGSRPKFVVSITPKSKQHLWQDLTLIYELRAQAEGEGFVKKSLFRPGKVELRVPWLSTTGSYQFRATFEVGSAQITAESGLINFDVKSSDTLVLFLAGIITSAVLALSASICGGIIVGNFLDSDDPQPVIIVNGEPPASH